MTPAVMHDTGRFHVPLSQVREIYQIGALPAALEALRTNAALVEAFRLYAAEWLEPVQDPEEIRALSNSGLNAHFEFIIRREQEQAPLPEPDEAQTPAEFFKRLEATVRDMRAERAEARQMLADFYWERGYIVGNLEVLPDEEQVPELQEWRGWRAWRVKPGAPLPPESWSQRFMTRPRVGVPLGSIIPDLKAVPVIDRPAEIYPEHLERMLSAPPYIAIDRASRDGRNWTYDPEVEVLPYFEDGRTSGLRLTYGTIDKAATDVQAAAQSAVKQLQELDDRTADVWRVILWKATEAGVNNGGVYARIELDTRVIARLLGFKPHVNGGMKPEHLREVHKALEHLERMQILISPEVKGTLEADTGQGRGKRKARQLIKARQERVISVMSREVERKLDGNDCHMIWGIALGDWAKFFPRSYSPMFKALVELPNRAGKPKWAKRIGTELVLIYRQDAQRREKVKRLKWATLLDRAGLVKEVEDMRARNHSSRVQTYAEGALDILVEAGVIERWQVMPQHEAKVAKGSGKPGNFAAWLDSIVEITPPREVLEILGTITPAKPRKKRTPPPGG